MGVGCLGREVSIYGLEDEVNGEGELVKGQRHCIVLLILYQKCNSSSHYRSQKSMTNIKRITVFMRKFISCMSR